MDLEYITSWRLLVVATGGKKAEIPQTGLAEGDQRTLAMEPFEV